MNARPIRKVVEQHAEEAAFLWLRRNSAVKEPHYGLEHLARLDDRIEAHLCGLRIAGDTGWDVAMEGLGWQEAGEVFVVTRLALGRGDDAGLEEVLAIARNAALAEPQVVGGLISAIGWGTWDEVAKVVGRWTNSGDPWLRRLGVAGGAIHRRISSDELRHLMGDADAGVRARAARACGEMNRVDLLRFLPTGDRDQEVGFWATWTGALLGDEPSVRQLMTYCRHEEQRAADAVELVGRRLPLDVAIDWQRRLASSKDSMRLAIQAAGAIGSAVIVEWLMPLLEVPALARLAGEALTTIAGVDLAFEDLDGDAPAGFEAGPTEDPSDENVARDLDEDLPWPDPELLLTWWNERRLTYGKADRLLCGESIRPASVFGILRTGRQRQRWAAALEALRFVEAKTPLFETRARGGRQREWLERTAAGHQNFKA